MLEKVWAIWISGFLQPSLPHDILLDLGLTECLAVVTRTLDLYAQRPDLADQVQAPGTRLIDVFDRLDRALLILGAPGAGKTTLLLTLAQDLLIRAAQDPEQPIPVVFPLSSWAERRRPLAAWLVDALNELYDVPRKTGQAWVEASHILPLLDGLDEVAVEHREDCVEVINAFRQEHGLLPLAVCSRVADYEILEARLRLQGALVVQPLTREQVDSYLAQIGQPMAAVREALRCDPTLWELLETPLMLTVTTLAYAGASVEVLCTQGTPVERRQQLFATYVDRMFQRRSTRTPYTRPQTERWLTWLAWQMTQHNQTVFYLERMQPTWLPDRLRSRLRNVRRRTMRRTGLFIGLFCMLAGGPLVGLVVGLAAVAGVCVGTIRSLREGIEELRRRAAAVGIRIGGGRSLKDIWEELLYRAAIGEQDPRAMIERLIRWSLTAEEIISVETLHWSYSTLEPWQWRQLLIAVLGSGLISGLIVWIIWGFAAGLFWGVAETLFWGPIFITSGAIASSEIQTKTVPNEGIRRSAQNSLRAGLTAWLAGGLAGGLLAVLGYILGFKPIIGLLAVLGFSMSFGFAAAMRYGGYTWRQHLTLLRLLIRIGAIPRRYMDFLDYAVERIFLRKVGGGYIFIHRLLQDHFAAFYKE
jgi:eukaryotic-like serine/threonine-protein kinase